MHTLFIFFSFIEYWQISAEQIQRTGALISYFFLFLRGLSEIFDLNFACYKLAGLVSVSAHRTTRLRVLLTPQLSRYSQKRRSRLPKVGTPCLQFEKLSMKNVNTYKGISWLLILLAPRGQDYLSAERHLCRLTDMK